MYVYFAQILNENENRKLNGAKLFHAFPARRLYYVKMETLVTWKLNENASSNKDHKLI